MQALEQAGFTGTVFVPEDAELPERVACIVRVIGRARVRRYLREATDFDLLPTPELLGL